ncbi:hypothetical protein HG66A1_54090 [Gimesia chilikensis]|uniref:Uncharacterized protein n=1 Tax=Gimesia chilikensis TaxID=2605989 RepID=A0A517PW40_9PLAN|nr:hypothetical protein HG66A1_54090 [Gimesia chilikensis]
MAHKGQPEIVAGEKATISGIGYLLNGWMIVLNRLGVNPFISPVMFVLVGQMGGIGCLVWSS